MARACPRPCLCLRPQRAARGAVFQYLCWAATTRSKFAGSDSPLAPVLTRAPFACKGNGTLFAPHSSVGAPCGPARVNAGPGPALTLPPRPWWWAVHLAAALRQASGAQRGRNRLRLRRLAYELQDCHCFFLLLSPPQARAVVPFPSGMERAEQAQALPAAGASTMGSAWQQGHKIGCIYCWRRWSHQGSA